MIHSITCIINGFCIGLSMGALFTISDARETGSFYYKIWLALFVISCLSAGLQINTA